MLQRILCFGLAPNDKKLLTESLYVYIDTSYMYTPVPFFYIYIYVYVHVRAHKYLYKHIYIQIYIYWKEGRVSIDLPGSLRGVA